METLLFATCNGSMCINVNNDILTSMKSIKYLGTSAFNDTELLAMLCQCQAGCENVSVNKLGNSRVACTHGIGQIAQMSQLLFQESGEFCVTSWLHCKVGYGRRSLTIVWVPQQ
jgi:hypothetical protein